MSELQPGSFGKRKALWISVGVAAMAVVVVVSTGIYPSGEGTTSGTIVPAQRYRAEQPTGGDVKATGQTDATQRAQDASAVASGDALKDGRADSMKADGRADSMKADGRADSMKSDARVRP